MAILGAHREVEGLAGRDHRRRQHGEAGELDALDADARPLAAHELALAFEVDVDREQVVLGGGGLHLETARALAPITDVEDDLIAGPKRDALELERGRLPRLAVAAVKAGQRKTGGGEARGRVRALDAGVAVRLGVLDLDRRGVGLPLRADQERAAFGEAARADGVAQVDRGEAAGRERFVVGDTPNPEDFGRGLDELELVDVAIDVLAEVLERELAAAGDLALGGVDHGEADVGRQAVGNALAREHERVGPVPDQACPLGEVGGRGGGGRDLGAQRVDALAQVFGQRVGSCARLGGATGKRDQQRRERERNE